MSKSYGVLEHLAKPIAAGTIGGAVGGTFTSGDPIGGAAAGGVLGLGAGALRLAVHRRLLEAQKTTPKEKLKGFLARSSYVDTLTNPITVGLAGVPAGYFSERGQKHYHLRGIQPASVPMFR